MSITVVLLVSVSDVPVTVTVYVPAGVPGLTPVPPPPELLFEPLLQEESSAMLTSSNASGAKEKARTRAVFFPASKKPAAGIRATVRASDRVRIGGSRAAPPSGRPRPPGVTDPVMLWTGRAVVARFN